MYFIVFILLFIEFDIIFTSPNLTDLIMEATRIREKNLFGKVLCSFFGHKIITTRNVTSYFKEYKCSVCGIELTDDLKGHKTFLTPELKDINETLISLYQKRHITI